MCAGLMSILPPAKCPDVTLITVRDPMNTRRGISTAVRKLDLGPGSAE